MGLRDRIRKRAKRAVKRLVERVVGAGPYEGVSHTARTDAWPPQAMGAAHEAPDPHPHPADLAAEGRYVEPDFGAGVDEAPAPEPAVETVEVDVAEASRAAAHAGDQGWERMPMGSVAQDEFLPGLDPVSLAAADAQAARAQAAASPRSRSVAELAAENLQAAQAEAAAAETLSDEEMATPLDEAGLEQVQAEIVQALKGIYDPEIPVDIYELGLIYGVDVHPDRRVEIRMTLTSPNCPAAQSLPGEVEVKTSAVPGVRTSMVDIVWDPPWGPERMSEEARLELNL